MRIQSSKPVYFWHGNASSCIHVTSIDNSSSSSCIIADSIIADSVSVKKLPGTIVMFLAAALFSSNAAAMPVVSGNSISWTDDGWYQVQELDTYVSVCEGGRSCEVAAGRYVVINHTSGERWENISVTDTGPESGVVEVAGIEINGSTLSWPDNGWYQVQSLPDYRNVCEGGTSCSPGAGTYVVINHSSGERWENLTVGGSADSAAADTGTTTEAGLSIEGTRISWPDNGWYQVQSSDDFSTLCEGGRFCDVSAGSYIVINHSSGQRIDVVVDGGNSTDSGNGSNPVEAGIEPGVSQPIIDGNTLTLPATGWFQVQRQSDYETICEGTNSCTLVPGVEYIAINHSSGVRYPGLMATASGPGDFSFIYFDPYDIYLDTTVGEVFTFPIRATDDDGTIPAFTTISLPAGASLNTTGPGSAVISWTPTVDQLGVHAIEVEAVDVAGSGYSDYLHAEVLVRPDCSATAPAGVVLASCLTEQNSGFSLAVTTGNFDGYLMDARSLGDINGDGQDDIALYIPGFVDESDTSSRSLQVAGYIVFGGNPALASIDQIEQIDEQGLGVRIEQQPGSYNEATAMAPAGDFNNDGFDDFLVDANDSSYLIFGRSNFPGNRLVFDALAPGEFIEILDTNNGYNFYPGPNTSRIQSVGDFNGDGQADLVHAGSVFGDETEYALTIILGGLSSEVPRVSLQDLSAEQTFRLTGTDSYRPLAGGKKFGDFNGDGLDDLLLNSASENELLLVTGGSSLNGSVDIDELPSGSYQRFLLPGNSGGNMRPSGGGDFNGDGLSDFALLRGVYDNPSIVVVPGSSDISQNLVDLGNAGSYGGWVYEAPELRAGYADSLSFTRDFTGDGYSDLLIGIEGFSSTGDADYSVYQIDGSATPASLVTRSLNEIASRIVQVDYGFFGGSYGLRSVPDVSGDGLSELLVLDRGFETNSFDFVFGQ